MTVEQAYIKFQIPKNLQEHMLRTAALASIILDKWHGVQVDKEAIIKACAIHDIAKPMTFDLAKQTQFGMSESEIDQLKELQDYLKTNFGTDEHGATIGIAKEIGCSANTIHCLENLEWQYIPHLMDSNDINSLVPIYCDMRIGPQGILKLEARIKELRDRVNGDDYDINRKNARSLEKVIREHSRQNLDSITNDQINGTFNEILSIDLTQKKTTNL